MLQHAASVHFIPATCNITTYFTPLPPLTDTATRCKTLQHAAIHIFLAKFNKLLFGHLQQLHSSCNSLQHAATRCNAFLSRHQQYKHTLSPSLATHYKTHKLQQIATDCNTLHTALDTCHTLQHTQIARRCITLHNTRVLCSLLQSVCCVVSDTRVLCSVRHTCVV